LASGIALRRAGFPVTVFEAHPQGGGREVGAYLTIAVNGLDALHTLGLRDAVMAAGFPTARIEFSNGAGRSLGSVPIGGVLADGTATHSIRRSTLMGLLEDAARAAGVEIVPGRQLVAVERSGGRLQARFADGSSAIGDVLIGADGTHSSVRTLIDPGAPEPTYTGLLNLGGFSPAGPQPEPPGRYRMIFGRRCFFGYTVAPSGEVWWFGNPPSPAPLGRDELRRITTEEWKVRLLDLYAHDRGPAVDIVSRTIGGIAAGNQYEMPEVPRWHREGMVILGDAAHAASPTSGQGASMAIEDGVAIARALRDLPDSDSAFRAFEAERRERVRRVVAFGHERNQAKMPGLVGRVVRDLVLPLIFKRNSSPKEMAKLAWLFDHHIEWGEPAAAARAA
jgi:2-polyprenyl-6-methoxyphenol hydroxylase-like FAD-dependent oxidoreductase